MYCSSRDKIKVEMPMERDKWLKLFDGQCQFKVPFMLYADFESILKPVDDRHKVKGKKSYTEKINLHVPSQWCVLSTFAYGDVPDRLRACRGKDCVEEFVDYIESEVKRLYSLYPEHGCAEEGA